jgi:hypothetical protein
MRDEDSENSCINVIRGLDLGRHHSIFSLPWKRVERRKERMFS